MGVILVHWFILKRKTLGFLFTKNQYFDISIYLQFDHGGFREIRSRSCATQNLCKLGYGEKKKKLWSTKFATNWNYLFWRAFANWTHLCLMMKLNLSWIASGMNSVSAGLPPMQLWTELTKALSFINWLLILDFTRSQIVFWSIFHSFDTSIELS